MKTTIVLFASLIVISFQVKADDLDIGIGNLEKNKEASKENLRQYRNNLDIVRKNSVHIENSLSELNKFLKNLITSDHDIQQNRNQLIPIKNKVLSHIKFERDNISKENIQISEIENILKKLKKQIEKRKLNISVYKQKLSEIEVEREGWVEQSSNMESLLASVKEKVSAAEVEKKKWISKENSYQVEVSRWKKQVVISERQLRNYKRLSD